ncbi:TonB-dependent receptor plug domain-containing protein [Hydrogenimonas sp.]
MKLARGFKGRYFSLAAIAATVSCVQLQAAESSVYHHERHIAQTTENEAEEETETLEDIVVESALPSPSSLRNITSDVTVISSEELQEHHYLNVLQALQNQPDIHITQNGGPGQTSGFFIRGLKSTYTLVMIDGVRLNDPTGIGNAAPLERLSLADVERIEIVKGAQSGVWGADAVAGVVNIVTKKAAKGWHAGGELMAGSYTTHRGSLEASYGGEKFEMSAGFDGFKSDGFPPKTTSKFDAGDIERTYYAKAAARLGEATKLEGSYRRIVSDYDYDSSFTPTSSVKSHGSADIDLFAARLHQRLWGASWSLYTQGNRFERKLDGNPYKGHDYESGLKAHYDYGQGGVDAGASYRSWKMDESYGTPIGSKMRDSALFGSLHHRIDAIGLVVNAALRYDNYDAYDDKTTGKIGFKWLPISGWLQQAGGWLSANVATGYRAPSLYERFGGDGYTAANDDLKPESSTSYDVTAALWGLKATYFYQQITDMIQYLSGAYPQPGHYANVEGKSKIQGVEIAYARPVEALNSTVRLGYTYTDAKDENDRRLVRVPRHKATFDWTVYPLDALSIDLNALYVADYLDDDYSTFPAKRVQMGEYVVWNLTASYGFEGNGGLYLRIENLFDEEYESVKGYNSPERSLYAGYRFAF